MADRVPTMVVKDRKNGLQCTINVSDFNDELYEAVEPAKGPAKTGAAGPKTPTNISAHTREELSVMSLDALKKLPEWKAIDGKGSKDELVDKILAVREKIKAATHESGDE